MVLSDEQFLFFLDIVALTLHAVEEGWKVTPGEFRRTYEQQEIYFKSNRSKTMKSDHLRGLAADLFFFKDGKLTYDREVLRPLGEFWESLHPKNRWGGNFDRDWTRVDSFVDTVHFERHV